MMDEKMFESLIESTKEARAILRKETKPSRTFYIEEPSAKAIRQKHRLTQDEFARLLNISVGTLRNWEQGRRKPEGPARVLLAIADKHPEALLAL